MRNPVSTKELNSPNDIIVDSKDRIWFTDEEIDAAVAAARRTFKGPWRKLNGASRGTLLVRLAELLDNNAERLAVLETTDNGKTLSESANNMRAAARYYRFFAGYADKLNGEVIPMDNLNLFDFTLREPIGVIAILSPWNSPISILANSLAPTRPSTAVEDLIDPCMY